MLGETLLVDFQKRGPDSVFVMMTGDPEPALALEWMKKGASAYARKPVDPEYLACLCDNARRERAMLRIPDLLEQRTKEQRESNELLSLFV